MHYAHEQLPSVEQLEAFSALADLLHFQDAADSLGLSQPALSRRIQALETSIGVTLFDRSGRSVEMTPAGKTFLESSATWKMMLLEAQRRAVAASSGSQLSLSFVASAAITLIPNVVRRCVGQNPQMRVSLHAMHESEQWDALDRGDLDVICVRIGKREGYESKVLVKADPVCFVTYVGHPLANRQRVSVKDIVEEDLVLWPRHLDRQTAAREAAMFAEQGGDGMRIVYETSSLWSVLSTVASGLASSLLARSYQETAWPGVVFIPVARYSLPYALHWKPDNVNPALTTFLQSLD